MHTYLNSSDSSPRIHTIVMLEAKYWALEKSHLAFHTRALAPTFARVCVVEGRGSRRVETGKIFYLTRSTGCDTLLVCEGQLCCTCTAVCM